jgi:hypothetical protein
VVADEEWRHAMRKTHGGIRSPDRTEFCSLAKFSYIRIDIKADLLERDVQSVDGTSELEIKEGHVRYEQY